MRIVKKFMGSTAVILTALFGQSISVKADTTTLMELDATEPYDPLLFHADYLWIGKSRKDMNTNYTIDVVDRSNNIVKTLTLSHAVEHIYPYAADSIIAIGTAPNPNLRHFSIIKVAGGAFQMKDHTIPVTAWGNDWLGTIGGKEYFSDFGGNSQDEEGASDPNLPMQTIFSVDPSGRASYSKIRMRSPMHGINIGDELFIVRFYQLGSPARNVYRLNLRTGQFEDMFPIPRARLNDLIPLDNNLIVISETDGNRLIFIDRMTNEVKKELTVDGEPKSMQKFGACIAVGSQRSREVNVISIKNLVEPKIVAKVDFSSTGGHFRGLRTLAVDPQTGRLYGRSAYACNPGLMDCSKSWNSVVLSSQADADLLKANCL